MTKITFSIVIYSGLIVHLPSYKMVDLSIVKR